VHYNAAYFEGHYGRLMQDDPYFHARASYWRTAITAVHRFDPESLMLDYGCGTGQVSMAFPNAHYYDLAEFSRDLIKKRGRTVYENVGLIPLEKFDFVLSSHSLEHSPRPFEDLQNFARFVKPNGQLLLILPVERNFQKTLAVDSHNHLFCWTFQTICNLLHASGWQPLMQTYIYDSFGLGTLTKLLPPQKAVSLSWRLGQVKRSFKSMLIVAQKAQS
jgi:SAM-dependent methyltransferase